MDAKKYVEIEEAFTDKYGWEDGIDMFLSVKRNFWLENDLLGKDISDLTISQEYNLVNRYRYYYNKVKQKELSNGKNKKKKESN